MIFIAADHTHFLKIFNDIHSDSPRLHTTGDMCPVSLKLRQLQLSHHTPSRDIIPQIVTEWGNPKSYPSASSPVTPHCSECPEHQVLPGLYLAEKMVTQLAREFAPVHQQHTQVVDEPNQLHALICPLCNLVAMATWLLATTHALCPHRQSVRAQIVDTTNGRCMPTRLLHTQIPRRALSL